MKVSSRFTRVNPVEGFVALDNVNDVLDRIEQLVTGGRPMTIVQRYTYLDQAPDVYVGMVLDERWGKPIDRWRQPAGGTGMSIRLRNSHTTHIVNVSAYPHEADTEWAVNHRYIAEKAQDHICNITRVYIAGDVSGAGKGADDRIVIDAWNSSGVCTQTVIAFDTTTTLPKRDDRVAAWLKTHRDRYAAPIKGQGVAERWTVLDSVLDDYRDHADTGTPLDRDVEGPFHGADR